MVAEPLHPAAQVEKIINKLSNPETRLLVTSEVVSKGDESKRGAIVDVAHEALIRHWKLLRQWLEENRDLLRRQRKIEVSAVAWRESNGYVLEGLQLREAIEFTKNHSETFPLSDTAKKFIKKSINVRRWNRLKTASWLIIPALLVVGLVESNLHERKVREDYARLSERGTYGERKAVEDLVQGCAEQWLPNYFSERFFGNCRTLTYAPLSEAKLIFANLINASLRSANLIFANLINASLRSANLINASLRSANLSGANLINADLSNADLSFANLSFANLSNADLSNADLSDAILLNTTFNDTEPTEGDQLINKGQLQGDKRPYICKSQLPPHIQINPDRDCDKLPELLHQRYPHSLETVKEAREYIDKIGQ